MAVQSGCAALEVERHSETKCFKFKGCRFGWHSLVAAYGIAPEMLTFIPHGVTLPQGIERSIPTRHLMQHMTLRRLRSGESVSFGKFSSPSGTDGGRSLCLICVGRVFCPHP